MDSFTDFMRTLSFRITDHHQPLRWCFSFWTTESEHDDKTFKCDIKCIMENLLDNPLNSFSVKYKVKYCSANSVLHPTPCAL